MNNNKNVPAYELGFDDGYNQALMDLKSKCVHVIDKMIEKITKQENEVLHG